MSASMSGLPESEQTTDTNVFIQSTGTTGVADSRRHKNDRRRTHGKKVGKIPTKKPT
jgi:hypothetical protein